MAARVEDSPGIKLGAKRGLEARRARGGVTAWQDMGDVEAAGRVRRPIS
jgi:hypothetical protein